MRESYYYVFAGSQYHPRGGMHDFVGRVATLPEAYRLLANRTCDWWHIVENDRIIDQGERQYE